jgi:nucleoside-diphosphate-sugar epimerase
MIRGKKILVTGAGGFIGSHLVEALVEKGCKVRAFVHYNSFNRWGWLDYVDRKIKDSIEIFPGDVRDPNRVGKSIENIDVVFHLAALIGIPYSYYSFDSYVHTNIQGTLNILQAAGKTQVEKIIHISTSEVYGTAEYVPIDEKHPRQGQSLYSATKIGADFIAQSFYRNFDLPVTIARPFNTYGPREGFLCRLWNFHLNRLGVLSVQMRQQAYNIDTDMFFCLTSSQALYERLGKLFQTLEHTVKNLWLDISFSKNLVFSYFNSTLHDFSFPWGPFPWKGNRINHLDHFSKVRQCR